MLEIEYPLVWIVLIWAIYLGVIYALRLLADGKFEKFMEEKDIKDKEEARRKRE